MATDTGEAPVAVAPVIWATWLKIPSHYAMVPVRLFKWDRKKKELVEVAGSVGGVV